MEDLDGALADFDEAVRLDPQDAVAFVNRGDVQDALGDFERAVANYNEAIRLDPQNAAAFFNRGDTRQKQGDLEGAVVDFGEAISSRSARPCRILQPWERPEGAGGSGGALCGLQRSDPPRSAGWCGLLLNRGNVRDELGDVEGALSDYGEANPADPHDADGFDNGARPARSRVIGGGAGRLRRGDPARSSTMRALVNRGLSGTSWRMRREHSRTMARR